MKTSIELITPKKATELLEHNSVNRRLRPAIIAEYTRQMKTGLWKENTGEAIKIAIDSSLIDGQHRLSALIKADVSLNMFVIREMDKSIFSVIDTGSKRSSGDALFIYGLPNGNALAAGIKLYSYLCTTQGTGTGKYYKLGGTETISIYEKRAEFWDNASKLALTWYKKSSRLLAPSEFIGYYSYLYDKNPEKSNEFFTSLSNGENLEHNSSIKLLRDRLISFMVNRKYVLLKGMKTAFIFKCWNSYITGKEMKLLNYIPDKEKFPIAK